MPHQDLKHTNLIPTILSLNSDLKPRAPYLGRRGTPPPVTLRGPAPLVAPSQYTTLRLLHAFSTTTVGNIQQVSSRTIPIQTLEPTCCSSEMSELDQGHALWSVALRSLANPA